MFALVLLLVGVVPEQIQKNPEAQHVIDRYIDLCLNEIPKTIEKREKSLAAQEKILQRLKGGTVGNPNRRGQFVNMRELMKTGALTGGVYFRSNTAKVDAIEEFDQVVEPLRKWVREFGDGKSIVHLQLPMDVRMIQVGDIGHIDPLFEFIRQEHDDKRNEEWSVFIKFGTLAERIAADTHRAPPHPESYFIIVNSANTFRADQRSQDVCIVTEIGKHADTGAPMVLLTEVNEEVLKYIGEEFHKRAIQP